MSDPTLSGGFYGPGGLQIPPPGPETLHATYIAGANAGDQTINLLDVDGGAVTIDGTAGGFTGIYGLNVLANQHISRSLTIGIEAGVQPSARLHVAPGTAVVGTAPLKLDPGVLLGATESGAVESDGTNVYWTDSVGTRWPLNNAAAETLAQAYAAGALAFDQTLNLLDAKGGGVALNATTPLQVFVTAFEIDVLGGSVNFYRVGGFDVSSTISAAVAAGTNWNEVSFLPSTITLTGGPGTANVLSMVRVGSGVVNGVGNTATDSYNLLVDAAPNGTATLTRSWSTGFAGAVQAQAGLVLGTGLNPPTENDLVVGAGATVVSQANSGRLGYLAGATQTFMVSMNGGAYVPLLIGPAAGGFTAGSVPFGIAGGQLGQDNANFFWSAANATLQLGGAAASATSTLTIKADKAIAVPIAGSAWNGFNIEASTLTLVAGGAAPSQLNAVSIAAPFITQTVGAAYVLPACATLYLAGPPTANAAGGATPTLTAAGVATFAVASGASHFPDGAVGAPSVAFGTDATAGLYHTGTGATGNILGAINGANVLTLSANAVGLFTATPNVAGWLKALTILGPSGVGVEIAASTALVGATMGGLSFIATSNNPGLKEAATIAALVRGATVANRGADLAFYTKPNGAALAQRMVLDSFGNMGLGVGTPSASFDVVQAAGTTGLPQALELTSGAHTGMTAGSEDIGARFNFSATKTWATGAIATQREFVIEAPTYAFAAASTITTAASLAISGPPIVGANAAITNSLALWVQSGNVAIGSAYPTTIMMAGTSVTANAVIQATNGNLLTFNGAGWPLVLINGRVGLTSTPALAGATRFQLSASFTQAAAAGTAWDGVNFAASTLTLSGAATPVTALTFFTIAAPTVTAASAVVTTDFYTCRIGEATFVGAGPASATRNWCLGIDGNTRFGGGQTVPGKQILVGASPYTVLDTDYVLEVQSNGGAITVTLPALTGGTQLNGRIVIIKDSGYNAAAANITIARGNVADKVNNVAGSYTINVSSDCIWLKANTTNNDWEIL